MSNGHQLRLNDILREDRNSGAKWCFLSPSMETFYEKINAPKKVKTLN